MAGLSAELSSRHRPPRRYGSSAVSATASITTFPVAIAIAITITIAIAIACW